MVEEPWGQRKLSQAAARFSGHPVGALGGLCSQLLPAALVLEEEAYKQSSA